MIQTFTIYWYILFRKAAAALFLKTIAVSVFLLCCHSSQLWAQTSVTPASGGGNLCLGGAYVTLGDITLTETTRNDFRITTTGGVTSGTFILSAPSNFEFNPGVGTIVPGPVEATSTPDPITILAFTVTSSTISINYNVASHTLSLDQFVIRGIQVRAVGSASSGQILRTGGSGVIWGNDVADRKNHGYLESFSPVSNLTLTSSDTDNSICAGEQVTFTANATGAVYYEFLVNGVTVQNSTLNTYTTTTLTNGQIVTFKGYTLNSCQGNQTVSSGITTTVHALPTVSLSSSDADNSICAGETVTFTATSTTATTYQFFVGTTLVQSTASNTYTTSTLTSGQTVTVRAITANGCSAVSSGITTTVNPLPTVTLTSSDADNSICAGETVTFTASSTIAATFEFFVNGSSVQSGASNSYTSSTLTSGQTVTVRARTASGCSATSAGIATTVNALPTVTLSSSDADNSICAGETITFTATSNTATSYEFFVNGISRQNSATNTFTTAALTHGQTVTVRVRTASGCSALSSGITTTVNALPAVTLTSSDSDNRICAGESVTFTASSTIAATFEFFVNGSSMQSGASATYASSTLTNGQTVTVRATTANGCSASSAGIATTVHALPTLTLSSSDADNSICAGETVIFTASSTIAATFEFFVNGNSVQSGASNTYTSSTLTNGQVLTVRATTANGCSVVSSGITTTVYALPAVNLSSSDADNSICAGETVTFTASSTIAAIFEFFVNGSSVQSGVSATYTSSTLTSGQTVRVRATTASGCSALSNAISTTVQTLTATLSSSDADNVICAGETVTFTVNAPTATTYEFFVNGVSVQNSATNIYSITTLTSGQTVSARATTASGCSALSNAISTTVNALPTLSLTSNDSDNVICAGETIILQLLLI
jgi:uncharacterized cupredoxin-like copper-binding protein